MAAIQVQALKVLDRLVGRTIYRFLLDRYPAQGVSAEPAPRPDPALIKRILVIRPGGIGDAVLFFPMLRALRREYPLARLEVLAERRNVGLFEANDVVHAAWAYDRGTGRELLKVLRGQWDLVVDTEQYHFLSSIFARLTRAPVRCGFDTQGRGGLFTHRVHYTDQVYEVYSFLDLVAALTGRPEPFEVDRPFFPVSEPILDWARVALRKSFPGFSGRGLVVISPGATMRQRQWAPERYRELARWLVSQGLRVAVIGGAGDTDSARAVAEELPDGRVENFAGATSLSRTAAIIALADLYISSDTGPLHIAYGVGTPTVHLFGSGILEKWAPPGSRYRAVHKALPCSPCTRYGYTPPCPYGVECMKQIGVQDVISRLEEALADSSARRPA